MLDVEPVERIVLQKKVGRRRCREENQCANGRYDVKGGSVNEKSRELPKEPLELIADSRAPIPLKMVNRLL